jgi:hypothetical protein
MHRLRVLVSLQFRDFILDMQLAAFQLGYLEFVKPGVALSLVDLPFQRLVTPFEFRKMRVNGHSRLHVSRNDSNMTQKPILVERVPAVA